MGHELLEPEGATRLLLGNEAVARGALEAGVNLVSCYPGTPSSEVPDTLRRILDADESAAGRFRLEYSINEKVAVEVAVGASLGGALTMATMKHVGMNVAADPLFTAAYVGLPGGFALLCADDPLCHSSQNEQDNRAYARFMGLPCLEPANAQEAKDMARDALLLSRQTEQPFLLRTTTRVSHLRGAVRFGPLPDAPAGRMEFPRNPGRFVPVPAVSRQRHIALAAKLDAIRELAETSPWNACGGNPSSRVGVIASGVSRAYLADALEEQGWGGRLRTLELGFSWPVPEKAARRFMDGCDRVLVLEEGEPLLERDLRALAQREGLRAEIRGKGRHLSVFGEYSVPVVARALADLLEETLPAPETEDAAVLPGRPPNLCPGCSHRAVYYAVRKVFGDTAIYASDIGCYTLGMSPPLRMADFLFCMGSSVSAGSGFSLASGRPVVSFIGDSTFFHSGVTGLANAVFNRRDLLVVILDNGTTAMTGHQPNPGVDGELLGEGCAHLDIEALVRGCGVTEVATVRAYNLAAVLRALEGMKTRSGVRVIIAREPCVLVARRALGKKQTRIARVERQDESVRACLAELACPAFRREGEEVSIDASLCSGCMVCMQISPAIGSAGKRTVSSASG